MSTYNKNITTQGLNVIYKRIKTKRKNFYKVFTGKLNFKLTVMFDFHETFKTYSE